MLRAIATVEGAKALVVLLLGFGLLSLIHKNLDEIAEQFAQIFSVSPDGKLSHLFMKLAVNTTDHSLWLLAIGALVYAAIHAIEAFGLWRARDWAQWVELLSTASYLPPQMYWLDRDPTWMKSGVLVANLLILFFMLILRIKAARPALR